MSKFVLAMAICGVVLAVPAGASAESISGTVTDETSHLGIAGVEVCPRPEPYQFEVACTQTDADGAYELNGLLPASYYIHFYTYVHDLNYVQESYDDKLGFTGDLVDVPSGANVTGIDAQLAVGGIVVGTVTNAEVPGPAANVQVCASRSFPEEYFEECGLTGVDGKYAINALPGGEYSVHFGGSNDANFLQATYEDGTTPGLPTKVPVTGATTTSGIDAALMPGAQILGTVTDAGSGVPQKGIEVCLYDTIRAPEVGFREPCVETDAAGNYAIRGLRPGTYDVVFSHDYPLANNDPFFEQWYDGVATLAQATAIAIAPPETRTGVDARLIHYPVDPRRETVQVDLIPTSERPSPQPLRCKKNQRKKWVRGKYRCVKKPRKHGRHHGRGKGGHGPHAVATDR